jgi:hypothetical protein
MRPACAPSLGERSHRTGVHRERGIRLGLGAIDRSIGGRIDQEIRGVHRDNIPNGALVGQIEFLPRDARALPACWNSLQERASKLAS